MKKNISKIGVVPIYLVAVSFIALAIGFSDNILANYFKDAYDASAVQRGFIEIPRELPGIITVFMVAALARFGDIRIAAVAQFVAMLGIVVLAVWTPSFYTMTAVLFVFSMGVHMYLPIQDSLALSIMSKEKSGNLGTHIGNVKGVQTAVTLVASLVIFFGFRFGLFSFKTEIKLIFIVSGICFLFATLILLYLNKRVKASIVATPKVKLRKKYGYYYVLAVMHGVQKQVVIVYAPWVIIEILGKGADTMSVLLILSSVAGMFFMPFLGKCLDRFGIRTMLYADAWSFIFVYLAFAYMTYNLFVGNFEKTGIAVLLTFLIFIVDRMSSQMGFIRTVYLDKIVEDKNELMATVSFGMSLDHVVSIACSYVSGFVWVTLGPHYIFIFAASLSLINLLVAKIAPIKE